MRQFFLVAISFGLLLLIPGSVRAQEADQATPSAEVEESSASTSSSNLVFTKPRQTEEILRLRELYQDQVEKYTNLEREFYINKAQFQKLNTLQSLEEAIVSTREVMLARTDVLITYFELLRASLEDTEGVELTKKQEKIDDIVGYIEALKEHRQAVLTTVDREGVTQRVEEFAEISAPFSATAYQSVGLIRIGDIQAVYDKSLIIYQDVLKYHQENPTSALQQQERERAYRQVDQQITKVRGDLLELRTEFDEARISDGRSYNQEVGRSMNTAYSGVSQILAFLEELFVELT